MKTIRIPLMILSVDFLKPRIRRFLGIGYIISSPFSFLKSDLEKADIDCQVPEYIIASILNASLWGLGLFLLLFGLLFIQEGEIRLLISLGPGALIFLVFFALFLRYPRILVKKTAERIDRNLSYALKDLLLQVSSGVCLFDGMLNVSKSDYGEISDEFRNVVRDINAGKNEVDSLEKMGVDTESRFVKKTIWQLVNVMRSGASVVLALRSVVNSLVMYQRRLIRDFTQELNLWSLIYMMFAVIAPTMGTTLLIVLSAFGGAGVSKELFIGIIIVSFFVQASIVGFVRNRRPVVHG